MNNKFSWITVWPIGTYYAAYIDPIKSLPHKTPKNTLENQLSLPFWIPEQRYLANLEDYLDVIKSIKTDEFVFEDPVLKRPLIKYRVEKGKSAIYDGKIGNGMVYLQYSSIDLLAWRKRDDGLLGVESLSGAVDTRLSKSEFMRKPKKFPVIIRKTNKEDANFSKLLTRRIK